MHGYQGQFMCVYKKGYGLDIQELSRSAALFWDRRVAVTRILKTTKAPAGAL